MSKAETEDLQHLNPSEKKDRKKLKIFKKETEHLLRMADKVLCYRSDILPKEDVHSLKEEIDHLSKQFDYDTLDQKETKTCMGRLKKTLKRVGGPYYPQSSWAENVEMFLVASILAIGIRTYFFQPFKIPTNSMYPTYNGMTHHVYHTPEEEPGPVKRFFRKLQLWTKHYKLIAPKDGDILIPINIYYFPQENFSTVSIKPEGVSSEKAGRGFRARNARKLHYSFRIVDSNKDLKDALKNDSLDTLAEQVNIKVPGEFGGIDKIFRERFFPESPRWRPYTADTTAWIRKMRANGTIVNIDNDWYFRISDSAREGKSFLTFDILTGDALFVDRFSYHFFKPKLGDPYVFRTKDIPGITKQNNGVPDDKYYIKRLVGTEGDTLEIRDGTLYNRGKPIEGADAFEKNASKDGEYEGYVASDNLAPGRTVTIPKNHYYAMGDNSDESADSRRWGVVPEKTIVGKAIFIYYPFTHRWGPAK